MCGELCAVLAQWQDAVQWLEEIKADAAANSRN
jgi:hypothetical protein